MIVKHIKDNSNVADIDKYVGQGKNVFILVYMVGCGPCNATRPEWAKLESALKDQYANNDDLVVIDVDQELMPQIKSIGDVEGFPTMKYVKGNKIENYENSGLKNTDRSVDSFINWVESKITNTIAKDKTSSPHHVVKRLSSARSRSQKGGFKKRGCGCSLWNKKGGCNCGKIWGGSRSSGNKGKKWSRKYKRSINCKRPKGFSQKQYCKYSRNKR